MQERAIHIYPSKNLVYEPDKWNVPETVKLSNCFAYAFDCQSIGMAFWRHSSNAFNMSGAQQIKLISQWRKNTRNSIPSSDCHAFGFSAVEGKMMADFMGLETIKREQLDQYRDQEDHVIAYLPAFGHLYRRDSNGLWSQKKGIWNIQDTDDEGNSIEDLESARFFSDYNGSTSKETRTLIDMFGKGAGYTIQYYRIPDSGVFIKPKSREFF